MGRMHSNKKGKSRSKKPLVSNISWVRYPPKEVELLITKLAKEGLTSSHIGVILRDSYGIPNVKSLINKNLTDFLKEKGLISNISEDISSLSKSVNILKKHLEVNKHDMNALRGLQLTNSKIKRLEKYYNRSGKIN